MARIVLIPGNMKKVASITRNTAEEWANHSRWLRNDQPPRMPPAEMKRLDAEMSKLGEQLRQLVIHHSEAERELLRRAEKAEEFYGGLRRQNLPVPDSAFWKPRNPKVPWFKGTLKVGDSGEIVMQLQRRLRAAGLNPGGIDGAFGPKTKAAVMAFQRRMGLPATGVVDTGTARALGLRGTKEPEGGNPKTNRELGRHMMLEAGWGIDQWPSLESLWTKESGWNQLADNPGSDAYGIPQALPGSKMASAGADWRTSPKTQIKWGLGYIRGRYGSPKNAWAHFLRMNWY